MWELLKEYSEEFMAAFLVLLTVIFCSAVLMFVYASV